MTRDQEQNKTISLTGLLRWISSSIRRKIVLPYLFLTLIVIGIGTYVVTNLVVTSLDERLNNQLLEAGRVVSDSLARREIEHLESARAIAFTLGLAEAVQESDRGQVIALAQPAAAVRGIELVVIVDAQGKEMLHGLRQEDGTFDIVEQPFDTSGLWMVQALLDAQDPNSLPKRSLGLHATEQRYYYLTAIPIGLDDEIVGVIIVGTPFDTLLPLFKRTALADVILYVNDGQAMASTFVLADRPEVGTTLEQLSISPELYQDILANTDVTHGENIEINTSPYRIARGPLRVGNDNLGVFAVALPTNFVIEQRVTNRNIYVAISVTAMIGISFVGYLISQRITHPINRLVRTSQAVAEGDLEQRTGIVAGDEIGFLAETFDEMTGRLAERTRALEETLGRMRAILSSIGDGVVLEDLEQEIVPLNTAAETMIQDMRENLLLGPLRELFEDAGAVSDPRVSWPQESRRFEVGKKVLSAHSAPVRTQDDEHMGTVVVLRDVTSEAEAERLKDAFIAHVSHELRTPLTSIKGYCELMLMGATGQVAEKQQRFLKTIHHHTENLVDMINTLLDFTEVEAWDKLQLNLYPTQLSTLVEETAQPWRTEMNEKKLAFQVDIHKDLPMVNIDAKRMTWVIVNLIRNAWQYTPEGGSVAIRLHQQDGNVILDVKDTGIGISKEDQQLLFSRFFRVASEGHVRGIGLGLYVAKTIVEAHEGTISVESEAGSGSTFSVSLPAMKDRDQDNPRSEQEDNL